MNKNRINSLEQTIKSYQNQIKVLNESLEAIKNYDPAEENKQRKLLNERILAFEKKANTTIKVSSDKFEMSVQIGYDGYQIYINQIKFKSSDLLLRYLLNYLSETWNDDTGYFIERLQGMRNAPTKLKTLIETYNELERESELLEVDVANFQELYGEL
jgi:hypothetical protein